MRRMAASAMLLATSPIFAALIIQNWDTILEKNWSFRESMKAQFRFETFNTFNHPNFYAPGNTTYSGCDTNASTTCSPGFGEITAAFPGRIIQFAGKFYW